MQLALRTVEGLPSHAGRARADRPVFLRFQLPDSPCGFAGRPKAVDGKSTVI